MVSPVWRVLPFTTGPAEWQLRQSALLWQQVASGQAPATLRWYGYDSPALVLGVGQRSTDVDEPACRAAGIAIVKRSSGGSTVLVNQWAYALDIALPAVSPLAGHDVIEAYRWVGDVFARVLREMAPTEASRIQVADVALARADQASQRSAPPDQPASLRGLSCFGVLSPYEVVLHATEADFAKLVGLSQVRKRGVVLYQVGLYARHSGADLAGFLGIPPTVQASLAVELERRIASLEDIGLSTMHVQRLMAAFNHQAPEPRVEANQQFAG
jgi:lipoate-protein ligase A